MWLISQRKKSNSNKKSDENQINYRKKTIAIIKVDWCPGTGEHVDVVKSLVMSQDSQDNVNGQISHRS